MTPGATLRVASLDVTPGATVELDRVLLISNGEQVKVGTPTVAGAKVVATAKVEGKARKVVVFKFKSKTRYHRTVGHRQPFTELSISQIVDGEAAAVNPAPKPRRARKPKEEKETESGS